MKDITGIEIFPSKGGLYCDGAKNVNEICCDECDYFLECYPEWNSHLLTKSSAKTSYNKENKGSFSQRRGFHVESSGTEKAGSACAGEYSGQSGTAKTGI